MIKMRVRECWSSLMHKRDAAKQLKCNFSKVKAKTLESQTLIHVEFEIVLIHKAKNRRSCQEQLSPVPASIVW
jgi:hypothetical protein